MNEIAEAVLVPALPSKAALPVQELMAMVLGESSRRPMKQIMLLGATPGVGTTFLAAHFANQLAHVYGKVLLIEVRQDVPDLYPSAGPIPPQSVTRTTMQPATCLALVAGGRADLPVEWLNEYGLILWDVPPMTVVPVSIALASYVDGIVLLAQAYKTRRQVAMQAVQRLEESGGRMMGVVLNRVKTFIPPWVYRLL